MNLRTIVLCSIHVAGALALSCRDATQVRVRVVTNLACPGGGAPEVVDTSVLAGAIGKVRGPIQAQTLACTPGSPNDIGDVYVFPREDKDGSAEVWVVAGHLLANGDKKTAEDCVDAYEQLVDELDHGVLLADVTPYPSECIIAKRRLAFVPHEGLEITVFVDAACAGNACDPDSTCYKGTQCVPSDAVCEDDGTCMLPEEGMGGAGTGATAASASNTQASASAARGSVASDASSGADASSADASSGGPTSAAMSSGGGPCELAGCAGCGQCCTQSGLGTGTCDPDTQQCLCAGVTSSSASVGSSSVSAGASSSTSAASTTSVSSVSVASSTSAASSTSVSSVSVAASSVSATTDVSSASAAASSVDTSTAVSSGSGPSMSSSADSPPVCIEGAMITVTTCAECDAACDTLSCFGPPTCVQVAPGGAICTCGS